jgi:tyrosyl-tRNA synthetase
MFRDKQEPEVIEDATVPYGQYKLSRLLADVPGLASSVAEARRLIAQGAVRVNGDRVNDPNFSVDLTEAGREVVLQVGKLRFVRVQGQ